MKNPDQITVRQHVFPKSEIKRFCANGVVAVFLVPKSQVQNETIAIDIEIPRLLGPKDDVFVTQRAWDRNSEESRKSLMTVTEKNYQVVAKKYATQNDTIRLQELNAEESLATTQFYCLWRMRAHFRIAQQTPIIMSGVGQNQPGRVDSKPATLRGLFTSRAPSGCTGRNEPTRSEPPTSHTSPPRPRLVPATDRA
jgi:hypothetical protein